MNGGLCMAAPTLLWSGLEATVGVAIRAEHEGMRALDLELRLLIVPKSVLAILGMAALALVSQRRFVNIIFLVATSLTARPRRIREARIGMAVHTLWNRFVAPSKREVSVFLMCKASCGPFAGTMAGRAVIA